MNNYPALFSQLLIVCFLLLVAVDTAGSVEFDFVKIVDTDTPIPGGEGNFTDFSRPQFVDGKIAFFGQGVNQQGIFIYESGVVRNLVDLSAPSNITAYGSLSFDGTNISFFGAPGFGAGAHLIYSTDLQGNFEVIVDRYTIEPRDARIGRFPSLQRNRPLVTTNLNGSIFITRGPVEGILLHDNDGGLTELLNTETFLLDDNSILNGSVSQISSTNEAVFFSLSSTGMHSGAYGFSESGDMEVIANGSTPIPEGVGTFLGTRTLSSDNSNVSFLGFGKNQEGIYLAKGDGRGLDLSVVANLNTHEPVHNVTFTSFAESYDGIAIEDDNVAFRAESDQLKGAYLSSNSGISRILDSSMSLNNQQVVDVHLTDRAIYNGSIALQVDLSESFGIYVASPPPPPEPINISGNGQTVFEDFEQSIFPPGWSATVGGQNKRMPMNFPPESIQSEAYDVGALAIGVRDSSGSNSIQFDFQISDSSIRAIRLQYDIEAWAANPNADNPGEAAFQTTLDVDGETLVDFGTTTTGKVLTPGLLNGNEEPNRTSFDSGVVEIEISPDTPAQINWVVPKTSSTSGWLFGIDNVIFRTLAPGDVDGDGIISPTDLSLLLAANTFGKGDVEATWSTGDFDGDLDFDAADVLAILQALGGKFPKEFVLETNGELSLTSVTAVPEPATSVLLLFGIPFLLVRSLIRR